MKDENAIDVDVHLYRLMIGSLMHLTSSRPDIIFDYPKDSPFDLEAYTDSDYVGASLGRISTTGGCQFLGSRLISWQCKKQTIVANSTTEAEYVAVASSYGQVLWIQNQMLDYGYNFMNTKIFIDNESTICIVKNLVFHSKTKHIEIRHHFIRDSNEKKLIHMIKIHTDQNVEDLLTKAFDATSKAKTVNGEVQIQALVDGKKVIVTEMSVRRALQLKDTEGTECLPNDTIFAELERIGAKTTAWNEFSSTMASARGGKGFMERYPLLQTMMVQAQEEGKVLQSLSLMRLPMRSMYLYSNDPLLSGEDRLKLNELMELCTNLSQRVLDLENTKTSQAVEIAKLKKRGNKIANLDVDAEEVKVEKTLIEIKAAKPKAITTTATTTTAADTRPKARGVVVQEPNEEIAQRLQEELQAELEEEERLARQKEEEDNLISWDNTQAMMEVVEGSKSQAEGNKKRTREELESDNSKKKKIDENAEDEVDDEAEMKKLIEIVPDDKVAIDAIPLATKSLIIVD
ncbi:hypothetical protein Tco_1172491 [Tanacetum coccineum]